MLTQDVHEKEKTETPRLIVIRQKRSVSRGVIYRILTGIILLLLLVQIGFFKTYISHFPGFTTYIRPDGRQFHFSWVMHFHGMMMVGWVLMLLLQPVLILKGKIKWHHRVGSLSYVLAPLVVLSMWLITQERFYNILEEKGYTDAIARLSLNFPNIIFFALLYSLAIYYRKRSALHIPFMCGTAILLIGPGLARMLRTYFEFTPDNGVNTAKLAMAGIAAGIAIADSARKKRISPFSVVLAVVIVNALLWFSRYTPFWQTIGGAIAKMF